MPDDGQVEGADFFAQVAFNAEGWVDVKLTLASSDEALKCADGTEGAPGAGVDGDSKDEADAGRDGAHEPENLSPVTPVSGILGEAEDHESHEGGKDYQSEP